MKIIKVGKYTLLRHWFKWYWIHQIDGGNVNEENHLRPLNFTTEIE